MKSQLSLIGQVALTIIFVISMTRCGGDGDGSAPTIPFVSPTLDATFGNNGVVIYDGNQSGFSEIGQDVALQADGKIIVAGYADNGLDRDVLIQRYNTDGTIDSSFASSGTFIFNSGVDEAANDVVIQPDGKIIITGYMDNFQDPENIDPMVMRLNVDGQLDNTFGSNGIINIDLTVLGINDYREYGQALAIQSDGRLVVMSYSFMNIILSRHTRDGSLDDTFGDNGLSITNLTPGSPLAVQGGDMAIQEDGKIIVVSTIAGKSTVWSVIMQAFRVNADGSHDDSFSLGTDSYGVATTYRIYANAVLVQADSRIIIGGTKYIYSNPDQAVILRLNANGALDTAFGDGGYLLQDDAWGSALDMSSDEIVLAGRHNDNVLTTRVASDGAYSTALSMEVAIGDSAAASDVALQSNGDIVITGYRKLNDDLDLFLMRLTAE